MKTISVNLYTFNELSEEVQQEIINKNRYDLQNIQMTYTNKDYLKSLEEFANICKFKVTRFEVNSNDYDYNIRIYDDYDDDCNDYIGEELLRYLNNRVLPYLYKGNYYFKWISDNPPHKLIKRYSKVLFNSDCVLTGVYCDNYLTDILLKNVRNYKTLTYEKLIEICLNNFFKHWKDEFAYYESNEAIKEILIEQEQYYLENGTEFEEGTN